MADERASHEPEHPRRMVRFDFEPGASPKEIVQAIQQAREQLMAEYAAEKAKAEKKE